MNKGLVLCGVTVLFWALYAVYARYAASVWAVDPVVFGSIVTMTAGAALLAAAGPGRLDRATLRDPHTWVYGLLDVTSIILVIGAFLFASATELVVLLRVDVIYGLALAWLVFGRRVRRTDLVGATAILAGCAFAVAQMPSDAAAYAVGLAALGSLARAAATAVAERHPASNAADTVRARCRITGMVMLASGLIYLLATGAAAAAKTAIGVDAAHPAVALLPAASAFLEPTTLIAATGLGVLIYAPSTYFYFYASRIAGTETFFMFLVYQPILTVALEQALGASTPLPPLAMNAWLLGGMLCVIGGSTFMLVARHLRREPPPGGLQAAAD